MQITLDNNTIEVQQNPNMPLSQFLEMLQELELSPKNLYIVDYQCEPQTVSAQDKISQIESIAIISGSERELLQANVKSLLEYLDQLGMFLAEKMANQKLLDDEELFQYQEGISWLNSALESLVNYLPNLIDVKTKVSQLNTLDANKQEHLEQIMNTLATLRDVAAGHYQKLYLDSLSQEEKDSIIADFKSNMDQFDEHLESIASEISAGKENDAVVHLYQTVEQIHGYLSMLPQNEKNEEHAKQITSLLEQIVNALDEQDSVLAADLIDYDLKDFVKALLEE